MTHRLPTPAPPTGRAPNRLPALLGRAVAPPIARALSRLALSLTLAACTADDTILALEFTADPTCTPTILTNLASLSLEVYGDADGDLCTLARRCVTLADITDLEGLVATLRTAMQPLVDTDLPGTRQIAVLGHDSLGCGEADRLLCGFADLADADLADADADTSTLAVPLRCDPTDCPPDVPPFCPS